MSKQVEELGADEARRAKLEALGIEVEAMVRNYWNEFGEAPGMRMLARRWTASYKRQKASLRAAVDTHPGLKVVLDYECRTLIFPRDIWEGMTQLERRVRTGAAGRVEVRGVESGEGVSIVPFSADTFFGKGRE
jgi:hypothetical protein